MSITSTNPATNKTVEIFLPMVPDEVMAAIESAHEAYHSWRKLSFENRKTKLLKFANLLRADADTYSRLITLDMGKRISESRDEITYCANIAEYYANGAERFLADQPMEVEDADTYLRHEPLGVLLGVMPWNFPFYQVVRFAAPNIMAGNTVLVKHASNVPQCARAIEGLFAECGLPEGIYTNLFMSSEFVTAIVSDKRVQGVSLTGSELAGASVAAIAGKNLKRSVLELGGNDAFIVLEDAELESTVKLADPMDESTTLAPLSTEDAAIKLREQVQSTIDAGATVVLGGDRPDREGAYFNPTILTVITPDMPSYDQELFGPVASIYVVHDEAAAITLANDSSYGLGGSVFTSNVERGRRVAEQVETGMMFINQPTQSQAELPFGGIKNSGYGRELSQLGILEFVNKKLVHSGKKRS